LRETKAEVRVIFNARLLRDKRAFLRTKVFTVEENRDDSVKQSKKKRPPRKAAPYEGRMPFQGKQECLRH